MSDLFRPRDVSGSDPPITINGAFISAKSETEMSDIAEDCPPSKHQPTSKVGAGPEAAKTIVPNLPESMSKLAWFCLTSSLLSGPLLYNFDLTVVGTIQPKILEDFGHVSKLPWISVAYMLGGVSASLLWGRLFYLFNLKWIFSASVVVFDVGAAVSGAAPSINTFIVGRALTGVGAVGYFTGSVMVMSSVTTINQRPLYLGYFGIAAGIGTVVAPIIGGAFANSITWRWAFYLTIIISAPFVPGYLFLYPSKCYTPETVTFRQRIEKLDVFGNILWSAAFCTLAMLISFGGALYPWASGQTIGFAVSTGVFWLLLVVQQYFKGPDRIFPGHFFRSLELTILFLEASMAFFITMAPLFLIPLYFQLVKGKSAIRAGVLLIPYVAFKNTAMMVNSILLRKFGYPMPWFLVGGILCTCGFAPFLALDLTTKTATVCCLTALGGVGISMYTQAAVATSQARVEPNMVPKVIAFITAGQAGGLAILLAVSNTLFINRATEFISRVLPDIPIAQVHQAILGLSGGLSSLTQNLDAKAQTRVLQAIIRALNIAWSPVVASGVLSVILSASLKRDRVWNKPESKLQ